MQALGLLAWQCQKCIVTSCPQSWIRVVLKSERSQPRQPRQHGSLYRTVVMVAAPQRQLCQAAEQVRQLQVAHHPAAWSSKAHDNVTTE